MVGTQCGAGGRTGRQEVATANGQSQSLAISSYQAVEQSQCDGRKGGSVKSEEEKGGPGGQLAVTSCCQQGNVGNIGVMMAC